MSAKALSKRGTSSSKYHVAKFYFQQNIILNTNVQHFKTLN